MNTIQLRENLKSTVLFEGLPAQLTEILVQDFHPRSFRSDAMVMLEDQVGSVIYVIMSGTVKVSRSRTNRSTLLNISGPGELLGEVSLLDGSGHSADIVTLEETTMMWIERDKMAAHLVTQPILYRSLAMMLARRLRLASARLEALGSLDVPGRLAFQLLSFARAYGVQQVKGVLIPLMLSQGDLAELIGATRTRVNQALAAMRRLRLLEINAQNHITLLNVAELEKKYVVL